MKDVTLHFSEIRIFITITQNKKYYINLKKKKQECHSSVL